MGEVYRARPMTLRDQARHAQVFACRRDVPRREAGARDRVREPRGGREHPSNGDVKSH